jgi:cytochrome b
MVMAMQRVRVWDLPTRIFHWALALSVFGAFVSVKIGGNAMVWHSRFGMAALTLLLFRLAWGFVGPTHARFASFVRGPAAVMAQLRGNHPSVVGHAPLGALSVMALLALFTAQATLGLFTTDEIAFDGPLVKHVSGAVVEFATKWHQLTEWTLIGLVVLHIGAVVVHRVVHRHDLVTPMITGDQFVPNDIRVMPSRDDGAIRARAAVLIALAAGLMVYLSL